MGRGRQGIINQSTKKLGPRRNHEIAMFLGRHTKSDEIKITLQEDTIEIMKKMNKQQLVDFLLSKDN